MRFELTFVLASMCVCACVHGQCPTGDLNLDGETGLADLQMLATSWLSTSQAVGGLGGGPDVNWADFAVLAAHWREANCPVIINEILAHSHSDAPDWIELHNTGSIPVNIGGWLLSDKKNDLYRFRIAADTLIEPFGYIVFYEDIHFGNPLNPDTLASFALSENGETLYVYTDADPVFPNYLIEEPFGASETGNSFGRHRRSDGTYIWATMSEPTAGAANAYPLVGPVVINEIMYHPDGNADAEYVELLNVSGGPVTLFDYMCLEPWRFTDDSGIEFRFPSDAPVTLEKDEHLLLVRTAALVREVVPAGVTMFEWGSGQLANQGERLLLLKPGDVDSSGNRHWIEVDRVEYSDGSHSEKFPKLVDPWPPAADGQGPSLNRLFPGKYGNDPNNWQATIPTPGSTND